MVTITDTFTSPLLQSIKRQDQLHGRIGCTVPSIRLRPLLEFGANEQWDALLRKLQGPSRRSTARIVIRLLWLVFSPVAAFQMKAESWEE